MKSTSNDHLLILLAVNLRFSVKNRAYQNYKILIIEDNGFMRRVVRAMLFQIGFLKIIEANDGHSGLEAYVAADPDIILCDIEMEPINGLEFVSNLRKITTGIFTPPPVIFLTSHGEADLVMQAKSLNVDNFLLKPPSLNQLLERINYCLDRIEPKS